MLSKYTEYTDEKLAALAQQGDSQAEESLLRRYMDSIREKCHIYFIAGADSEDVIQEGMIGLFKAVQTYNAEKNAKFRTYANICVDRQIISAIRSAARRKHEPLNNSISLSRSDEGNSFDEGILSAVSDNPEDILISRTLEQLILEEGSTILSSFEQQVLKEFLAGRKYGQIAEKLGKSSKSIDNAMQRIRKKVTAYISS